MYKQRRISSEDGVVGILQRVELIIPFVSNEKYCSKAHLPRHCPHNSPNSLTKHPLLLFSGLSHVRHLSTVREHLSSLIQPTVFEEDEITKEGLTNERWSELYKNGKVFNATRVSLWRRANARNVRLYYPYIGSTPTILYFVKYKTFCVLLVYGNCGATFWAKKKDLLSQNIFLFTQ